MMESKDFLEVDCLKFVFVDVGLEVCMSKIGVELVSGLNFDVVKLEVF